MQVTRDLVERKTVAVRQRQHDRVLGRRGLQLEIELAAETLAQRQAPGAIQAAAKRRVDHELGTARFVEESLHRELALRRQQAERGLCSTQILEEPACGGLWEADFVDEPRESSSSSLREKVPRLHVRPSRLLEEL